MDPNQEQPDLRSSDGLIQHFDHERQIWAHLGDPFSLEMAGYLEEALLAFRADDDQLSSAVFEKIAGFVRARGIELANAILAHRGPCGARTEAWASLMALAQKEQLRTLLQFMLALQQPTRSAVVQ